MICGAGKCLFDCPRREPSNQVPDRSGLVIGSRCPAAAKGLLVDDRPGGFVVDVEVASGVFEGVDGAGDGDAVSREHRAGECVAGD